METRIVQKTQRPAQPGQPAHVRPAATRSEDSGGRMRVPAKLTRPLTSRLSVFGFQTRNTRPKPIVYPYQRSITIFRPNSTRSSRYSTKSRPDLDGSGQISARSGQISSPMINPKPTRINPKPMRPEPKNPTKSPGRFRVNFLFTRHIRVESGLGTNSTRLDPWTPLAETP